MKLQSMILITLAVLLAGCGESASERAAQDKQRQSEAHRLIADGLSAIEWGEVAREGGVVDPDHILIVTMGVSVKRNISVDMHCLPGVVTKLQQAAKLLRQVKFPDQPADHPSTAVTVSDLDLLISEVDLLIKACKDYQQLRPGSDRWDIYDKTRKLISASTGVAFLTNCPNPFDSKVGRSASTTFNNPSPGSNSHQSKSEITGVFGLKLGDPLPAQLVRKIDGWREMAEVGVYCVTPPQPSEVFDSYMVHLQGGPIYKIQASRNGRGHALVNIYDDAKKELISQFGPPTSTGAVDDRGDSGIAWEQNLRYGGRVRMTLALRKDSNAGYVVPGIVMLELQKLR